MKTNCPIPAQRVKVLWLRQPVYFELTQVLREEKDRRWKVAWAIRLVRLAFVEGSSSRYLFCRLSTWQHVVVPVQAMYRNCQLPAVW